MTKENNLPKSSLPTQWYEYFKNKYHLAFPYKKSDTDNPTNVRWNFLIVLANGEKPEWLSGENFARLKTWLLRFEVYEGLPGQFKKLDKNKWKKKNKLRQQGQKLINALNILQELSNVEEEKKKLPVYQTIHRITDEIIKIELTKLEIIQMHLLEKAQHIKRETHGVSLDERKKQLKENQNYIRRAIEGRKAKKLTRFSKVAKNLHLSRNTRYYFRKRENQFHFNHYTKKATKTSSSIGFINASKNFLVNMAIYMPELVKVLSELGRVLRAVPVLSTISFIIPILLNTSKVWLKKKNTRKKALTIVTIGGIIGVALIGIWAPLILGFVTVGLMVIGTIAKDIYPLIKDFMTSYRKKMELKTLQEKINTNDPNIGNLEKQYLMKHVEEVWINNSISDMSKDNLYDLRTLILAPEITMEKLINSGLIRILKINDLNSFILKIRQKHITDITTDIRTLHKERKNKSIDISCGVIGIVGALLLCFPSPPTIAVGVTLLALGALIGVIKAFDLGTKFNHFYHTHFNQISPPTTVMEGLKNKFKPVLDSTHAIINHLKKIPASSHTTNPNADFYEIKNEPSSHTKGGSSHFPNHKKSSCHTSSRILISQHRLKPSC